VDFNLNEITWSSIAAIATLLAVIVASIPIWREARRQIMHARSLRFRLCSKLTFLLPSLASVGNDHHLEYRPPILTPDKFQKEINFIAVMLQESSVLKTDEQDRIGVAFENLQMVSGVYGTSTLTSEIAKNVIKLIKDAISSMEQNGLLNKPVKLPWNNDK
jgi:hypothetical protein